MKNDYKVGYKKPPKEHQFKSKHLRDEAPGARTQRVEKGLDVAAWIDKPLKVKRRGKRSYPLETGRSRVNPARQGYF